MPLLKFRKSKSGAVAPLESVSQSMPITIKSIETPEGKKASWFDIATMGRAINDDLTAITQKAILTAKNWKPLFAPIEKLLANMSDEFQQMKDPGQMSMSSASHANFLKEVQDTFARLKPVIEELTKEERSIPNLLANAHILLSELPILIDYFNTLQLHGRFDSLLNKVQKEGNTFPAYVTAQLEKNIPSYQKFKSSLESELEKFEEMDKEKKFSSLSQTQKLLAISGMEAMNKSLEKFTLVLYKIAFQYGIKVDYLMSREIMAGKTLKDICEGFTDFYKKSLVNAGFKVPPTEALFPFNAEVFQQELDLLEGYAHSLRGSAEVKAKIDQDAKDIIYLITAEIERTRSKEKKHALFALSEKFITNKNKPENGKASLEEILAQSLDAISKKELQLMTKGKTSKVIDYLKAVAEENAVTIQRIEAIRVEKLKEVSARISTLKEKIQEFSYSGIDGAEEQKAEEDIQERTSASIKEIMTHVSETKELIQERISKVASRPKAASKEKTASEPPVKRLEKALQYLDSQLQAMLEKNIYRQFIQQAQAEEGMPEFQGEGWVKDTGNLLASLKEALKQYKELKVYFANEHDEPGIHPFKSQTPQGQRLELAEKTAAFAKVSKDIVRYGLQLGVDPLLQQLLSQGGYQELVQQPEQEEEVKLASAENLENHSVKPLENVLNSIEKFLKRVDPQNTKAFDKVIDTLTDIKNLSQELQKFTAKKQKVGAGVILSFLMRHMKDINNIIKSLPDMAGAAYTLSRSEFSQLLNNINLAMRDMLRMCKRIELELYLEPGYLTRRSLPAMLSADLNAALNINELPESARSESLHDLLLKAYDGIEKLGYAFKELYPFNDDQLVQLQILLVETQPGTIREGFIKHLVKQGWVNVADDLRKLSDAQDRQLENQLFQINERIDQRIKMLSASVSTDKKIEKTLLEKLKQQGTSIQSLDAQLTKLSAKPETRSEMPVMYKEADGRKLLASLRQMTASREDVLRDIEVNLERLTKKRMETFYFSARSSRSNLENTIQAYRELKQFLSVPGNNVKGFTLEHPGAHAILSKNEKQFLMDITNTYNNSPRFKNDKHIAGYVPDFSEPESKNISAIKQQQNVLLVERIQELKSATFATNTKDKKIKLLGALAENLKTQPLQKALEAIHADKKLGADYYLLHEGKTGKMLQTFSDMHATPKTMRHQIELEISRLQKMRNNNFYIGAKGKRNLIESRIHACIALSDALSAPEAKKQPLDAMLAKLGKKEHDILKKYESSLLEQLRRYETSRAVVDSSLARLRR